MAKRLPRIGITIGTKPVWRKRSAKNYKDAIKEAGGVPILIGEGDGALVEECQGLLFTGGWDVHPSRYPKRPVDAHLSDIEIIKKYKLTVEEARDVCDLPLARRAIAEDIPVFGICRGFQVLNIAAGGGMTPDIGLCVPSPLKHSFKKTEGPPRHEVEVIKGTQFAGLIGPGVVTVNTYHHQGVTDAEKAETFSVAAYASDGLIEAVEMPSHPFCMGVQWHPERREDPEIKERFRAFFDALVNAARERL